MNNGSYYANPTFPGAEITPNTNNPIQFEPDITEDRNKSSLLDLVVGDSHMDNILKKNKGKKITIFATFNGGKDKEIKGVIEESDKDNLILSNPDDGKWTLVPTKYIDYIEFDEKINFGI